jgi:hypothetical protein
MVYDYNRWAEKDEDRIRISSKNVWLQTGRSQYEGVYAFGYKVLGKKGKISWDTNSIFFFSIRSFGLKKN